MSGIYDQVQNPIPRSNLWVNLTLDQVRESINDLPDKDRALVYNFFMLTLNACHDLVEQEILSKDVFAG